MTPTPRPSLWHLSHRFDPRAVAIADRHYNRQKPGTPQFVPPGRCKVLLTENADATYFQPAMRWVRPRRHPHGGKTKAGLLCYQQLPDEMPEPRFPIGHQEGLAV